MTLILYSSVKYMTLNQYDITTNVQARYKMSGE